jgi:hypothetical protein
MILMFKSGKVLERKVEMALKNSRVSFKRQPLLVMNLRVDFIAFDKYGTIIPSFISKTNSTRLVTENKGKMFYYYLKDKILTINENFGRILDVIEGEGLIDCKTISKITESPYSNVKKLINGQKASLQSLGIIEDLGNYYKISTRFLL